MRHPFHPHLLLQQITKGATIVDFSITEEVATTALSAMKGKETGIDQITNIDEGEGLWSVPHREIYVLLDAIGHEEIVSLTRAVDSCGTEGDIVQTFEGGKGALCIKFGAAIGGVGLGSIGIGDGTITF